MRELPGVLHAYRSAYAADGVAALSRASSLADKIDTITTAIDTLTIAVNALTVVMTPP